MTRPAFIWCLVLPALLGCGGQAPQGTLVSRDLLTAGDELVTQNGMSTNGMSTNGMSTNGMSTNGLSLSATGVGSSTVSTKGLSNQTLASAAFNAWFQQNATYSNMVMTYVVRCAVPSGQTRTYTGGGTTYSWPGLLGVAPVWSSGAAIPVLEQQLVSACLAAHANRFGLHVDFSIEGYRGDGLPIPLATGESAAYPIQEGSFFGNLFNGGSVYSCSMGKTDTAGVSGPRECAMSDMPSNVCAPMINTDQPCWNMCVGANVPGVGWIYVSCTAPNGQVYPALDTSLSSSDIYWCGDGVCQFTESCYNPSNGTGCLADCGQCGG